MFSMHVCEMCLLCLLKLAPAFTSASVMMDDTGTSDHESLKTVDLLSLSTLDFSLQ